MQRLNLTKTIIYLRVFIVLFTAFTFLYGVKQFYGVSHVMEVVLLSILITTIGMGLLLSYYGSATVRHELRRKCGCYFNCGCEK